MEYVTYDSAGKLTGSYSQSMHPDHVAAHIEVSVYQWQNWTAFQANAARNGLEAAAPVAPTAEQLREAFKASRAAAVAAITVTIDGMQFDGDEISQSRMARAIIAMEAASVASTTWVLTTNVPTSVTLAQLKQALVAAGLAQSALWVQS